MRAAAIGHFGPPSAIKVLERPVRTPNGIEPGPPRRRRSLKRSAYGLSVDPKRFARLECTLARSPVHVPIAAVLPLADATQAHRRLAGGGIIGRMALRVRPG